MASLKTLYTENRTFKAVVLISTWMALSSMVIFQNKHILTDLGFHYPITLTAMHLAFQTAATRILKRYFPNIFERRKKQAPTAAQYTSVPQAEEETVGDAVQIEMKDVVPVPVPNEITPELYWRLVPIGVLFAASLVLSNLVYLYLSVSTIQLIKAGSPIAVMLASFAFGLKEPTFRLVSIILLICSGVGIASFGAVDFQIVGFSIQAAAIAVEATRLALIQTLLHGVGMSPLQSLYAFAPICLATLAICLPIIEGLEPLTKLPSLGLFILITNPALTFLLNLSAVELIDLSSLVLSLSKVAKDILLIAIGTVMLHERITLIQLLGYGIALAGLMVYKLYG